MDLWLDFKMSVRSDAASGWSFVFDWRDKYKNSATYFNWGKKYGVRKSFYNNFSAEKKLFFSKIETEIFKT